MAIILDYGQEPPPPRFPWRIIFIVIGVVIALIVVAVVGVVGYLGYMYWSYDQQFQADRLANQQMLLYQIDDQKVLAACIDLWQKQKPPTPTTGPAGDFDLRIGSSDSALPAIIRALQPNEVDISKDVVYIQFGELSWDDYGLKAYMNGAEGSGTKQLIPGLWYFSKNNDIPSKP